MQDKARTYSQDQVLPVAQNKGELETGKSQFFICPKHTLRMRENTNEF